MWNIKVTCHTASLLYKQYQIFIKNIERSKASLINNTILDPPIYRVVSTNHYEPRKDVDPIPVQWTGLCESGEI